ncbi:hypothetical protein [Nostoc sp.]|uniref:hypothetical protein n=1 Tax=Nostoc sp. TaxID=1180 RepID=UPI002FF5CC6D
MQSFNITLPDAIANTLNTYIKDQEVSIPANVVAEIALEDFLCQRGYLLPRKQGLSLTPASKGSGFKDTSANHDKILVDLMLVQVWR